VVTVLHYTNSSATWGT